MIDDELSRLGFTALSPAPNLATPAPGDEKPLVVAVGRVPLAEPVLVAELRALEGLLASDAYQVGKARRFAVHTLTETTALGQLRAVYAALYV
jgi:hypothetical protein